MQQTAANMESLKGARALQIFLKRLKLSQGC